MGLRIVERGLLPAHHVKGLPPMLLPLFIAGFRTVLDGGQYCVCIQAVLLVVFDMAGVFELKDHEPVDIGIGRHQYSQFITTGNVMRHLQRGLSALLSRKLITLGDVDVGDIAKMSDCRTALPVDFRSLLLCRRLLRPCRCAENYRKQKEKKERLAPGACHTFILPETMMALWSFIPRLATLFFPEVT